MMRKESELYPDYTAELEEIRKNGITVELLTKIIEKHAHNAQYNKKLYRRYMGIEGEVPISNREPRFKPEEIEGKKITPINNKINNDFFGEITDFKVGYFAGKAFSYSYSDTEESEEDTGGKEAVKIAKKALSDFVTLNNMQDVDMEVSKHASIYGYCGRLFYHDPEGNARVIAVPGFETIVLSSTNISEPEYAVRYYKVLDINGSEYLAVEFHNNKTIKFYEGYLGSLEFKKVQNHNFDYCPLQAVPNNNELIGDAEKVLSIIDAYDRVVSDSSNQIEGQVHSKEVYENVNITREDIALSNYTGALAFHNGAGNGRIYKLESNINDSFVEHHLARMEENIYRFSRTPNLNDDSFGNATGVALKFKLTGLETKCGMFQAKMVSAGVYMFKLLASSWAKKGIVIDYLQCFIDFKRNFPLDILSEAQAATALIGAGLPKDIAYGIAISAIDDVDYVMQRIEEEQSNIPYLDDEDDEDDEDDAVVVEEDVEEEEEIENQFGQKLEKADVKE